jgi:hypothetical protein
MKKTLFAFIFCFFTISTAVSQGIDPGYVNAFGNAVIIASIKGYPLFDKYDESQFIYKDGHFLVQNDDQSTLDLRVIMPKGMSEGKLLDKLKKEKPQNLKHKKAEYAVWEIWFSHTLDGRENITDRCPWPSKLSDEPKWSEPQYKYYNATTESKDFITSGFKWEDGLKSSVGDWIVAAKPGYKMYVIYRVAYEYSVPGGQIENKWDSDLKKFVPTKSTGGIGYVYSDPVAAGTIEVFGQNISEDRFKDNGDGTITDTKTNLMWEKSPSTREKFWNEAMDMAKECRVGNFEDWRLPTANELIEMMKISKAMDEPNRCDWLNAHGFSNILASSYWTSDIYILNGEKTSDKICVDMTSKITGGSGISYNRNVWLVRTPK